MTRLSRRAGVLKDDEAVVKIGITKYNYKKRYEKTDSRVVGYYTAVEYKCPCGNRRCRHYKYFEDLIKTKYWEKFNISYHDEYVALPKGSNLEIDEYPDIPHDKIPICESRTEIFVVTKRMLYDLAYLMRNKNIEDLKRILDKCYCDYMTDDTVEDDIN